MRLEGPADEDAADEGDEDVVVVGEVVGDTVASLPPLDEPPLDDEAAAAAPVPAAAAPEREEAPERREDLGSSDLGRDAPAGALWLDPDDLWRAALGATAALAMQRRLSVLNRSLQEQGLPPLRQGIGLHVGEVIAGSLGRSQRLVFTVSGPTVNLA